MKISFASCLLFILIAFSACVNDEETTESKLLGTWFRQEYWEDIGADGDLDQIHSDGDCDLDDEFEFKAGGALEYNDGTIHCDGFSFSFPGEWQLMNNNQELSIALEGFGEIWYYTITEISNTRLELNRIFPDDPNAHLPFEKLVLRR